ncbi:MAG: hypothetical protein DWP95_04675 [Proteobacteria bacterium]|nr:MAG: hypothetical protein DWP95_04675 [Pseudomonadota bacterium]
MKIKQSALLLGLLILLPIISHGKSAQEINILADATLTKFKQEVTGGEQFLQQAAGVLVFPQVLKAGLGVGGEYGEGVLREGGQNSAYYSTASASFGLQAGAQSKAVVIVFLQPAALNKFKQTKGWKAGVDGSVAIIKWGVGEDINTMNFKEPIVGFVFGNKGLMFNLTLEGSKITRISR